MIIVTPSFSKSSVFKIFPSTLKRKAGVFKFLRFEERFRDGLVWTVGLTVEIKLRFQVSDGTLDLNLSSFPVILRLQDLSSCSIFSPFSFRVTGQVNIFVPN